MKKLISVLFICSFFFTGCFNTEAPKKEKEQTKEVGETDLLTVDENDEEIKPINKETNIDEKKEYNKKEETKKEEEKKTENKEEENTIPGPIIEDPVISEEELPSSGGVIELPFVPAD
ncbi:MAG: hypothetical protein Q4C49_08795 [Bacillota bacterium]|nr:hypothetical protein [Bacillota bacterium]